MLRSLPILFSTHSLIQQDFDSNKSVSTPDFYRAGGVFVKEHTVRFLVDLLLTTAQVAAPLYGKICKNGL